MKTAGIIAEFNPFHNGHSHLIAQARKAGMTHIVVVLSGNFVQRGDVALFPKHLRARAAVDCGADLVLELPTPWAMSTAQNFACGALSVLDRLGCVDTLCFGSETADIEILQNLSELLQSPAFEAKLRQELETGATFAAARERAVRALCGEAADVLRGPNDLLAVEYVSAAGRCNASFSYLPVARAGAGHHDTQTAEPFASATALRSLPAVEQMRPFVPAAAFQLYEAAERSGNVASLERLETAVLAVLRSMQKSAFSLLPDLSEGIQARIYKASREATSLEALFSAVKTKRYPLARIRRLVLAAFLQLDADHFGKPVPYLRPLAMNRRGQALLRLAKTTARAPVLTRVRDIGGLDALSQSVFAQECRAADLYELAKKRPGPCGAEWTTEVYYGD